MLLLRAFFKKIGTALLTKAETKKSPRKRSRICRVEELESRDLLSATPWEWEWWDTAPPFTDNVPALYNTDPLLEDFGMISIGGNESTIDATTQFIPDITGNFLAYQNETRSETVHLLEYDDVLDDYITVVKWDSTLNDFVPIVLGTYEETFKVAIYSQDLGNGDWSYLEKAAYSYSYSSISGYEYKDGYDYSLSVSFINGIYNSTFTLTTGYELTDGFAISEETSDSTFSWTVALEYSLKDTATITHYDNTLTSERYGTDTRTVKESGSYEESELFSYEVTDYSVHSTFELSEEYSTTMYTTVTMLYIGND